MKYFNAFRIAAYVLVLYTLGHTLGAVINTPRLGAGSDAVVSAMKSVHVIAQGSDCTWYGFYRGFGWFVSIYFAFSAYAAWVLGGAAAAERRSMLPIAWALFASHALGTVIAFAWFFPVPMVFSAVVAALLLLGCIRASPEPREPKAATVVR